MLSSYAGHVTITHLNVINIGIPLSTGRTCSSHIVIRLLIKKIKLKKINN